MTADDWKNVEEELNRYYAVKLSIDNYDVTLRIIPHGMRLDILVYVNGCVEASDILNDTDIRRRFYQMHANSVLTAKDKKLMRGISKAKQKEIEENSKFYWYEPFWQSFRSLKLHLIKNNTSIELVNS